MAAEFTSLLSEYLDELPADHPDRRYLESLRSSLRAYVDFEPPNPAVERPAVSTDAATALEALHINVAEQAIEFEDRHGTVGRLRFGGETVLYEGQPLLLLPTPPEPTPRPARRRPTPTPPPASRT
jgi:hypothetical protein